MTLRRDPTKALQIGFLALLAISTAQVAWWVADQRSLARQERDRVTALYEADALAVTAAFAQATLQLPELMPHLEIDPELGTAAVRPESIEALAANADSRINRYTWEGGFFLLVLLGGMTVLTRTIQHDAQHPADRFASQADIENLESVAGRHALGDRPDVRPQRLVPHVNRPVAMP